MDNREVRKHKELSILREGVHSNWRDELQEEHPYVDVMPSPTEEKKDVKKKLAKKAMDSGMKEELESTPKQKMLARKNAMQNINSLQNKEDDGEELTPAEKAKIKLHQARLKAFQHEEVSIEDQMRISREAAKKRNPNPDHKAIRGKMLAKAAQKKDNRTDAEKMADATGPRKGSNFRGD